MFEFHVARTARDYYQFDQKIYAFNGNVIFANFHAAHVFALKMNHKRDLARYPERAVRASQINAMGLIDEILHLMMSAYRQQVNPNVLVEAREWLDAQLGSEEVEAALRRFSEQFPPAAVYQKKLDLDTYLAGETGGLSHEEIALEELLMLWLSNMNPAFSPYLELFDDADLEKRTVYNDMVEELREFFDEQPGFGPNGQNLLDLLRGPALASPHSLEGQLEFLRTRWSAFLGSILYRLLSSLDFISEEERPVMWGTGGAGPIEAIEFGGQEYEPEQYSPDKDWMPRLVLLAKNAYVWLDQLSKQYQRDIYRLDQIPDEELDILARRGITGLWLIGLWERSKASKRIKQMMGNPDAVASAYSLYDYDIAADLGGTEAMDNLRQRAWQRGIRMSSDMVPNHMAIDSRWVVEHPNWFLSLNHSPYPVYSFNGPDLSEDERVGIFLEDHYYDHSDASVVFKRVDYQTGDTRYIYHGNDGTMMPWNDTAQLDYLQAEVREAVIQTILHVARQFPVIRFDAAMTLAKRHIQRLWFPEPGSGGAIASRAEHGMTRAQFDAAMPIEFWREVVDRVAEEVPDTLLLAEAFWLLEGYFVRTLGMHRVYNSAFMHMLRDEDNAKYRQLIKNTIEFDPEILKRYVNFMSNPDEETAIAQFDKGDKYFGVATILATVPGLPMFGHGQFEGYAEKYGMEYRRAYWDEQPDQWLVDRHMQQIAPLLHRRYLFAEVQNFLMYDFFTANSGVDENVIAYSNRAGSERGLVIYHNKWGNTAGWLRTSAAYLDKGSGQMMQKTLTEGLNLSADPRSYVIFRDYANGREYIRNSRELVENGMYVELGAYQRHVFMDFRDVYDADGHYAELAAYLNGRGVPDIEEALTELVLRPVHGSFRTLVNADTFRWLLENRLVEAEVEPVQWSEEQAERLDWMESQVLALLEEIRAFVGVVEDDEVALEGESGQPAGSTSETGPPTDLAQPSALAALAADVRRKLEATLRLPGLSSPQPQPQYEEAIAYLNDGLDDDTAAWGGLFAWVFTHELGKAVAQQDAALRTRSWMDEWLLAKLTADVIQELGVDADAARRTMALVKLLVSNQDSFQPEAVAETLADLPESKRPYQVLSTLLQDIEAQNFLQINRYGGVLWYNKEAFAALVHGLYTAAVVTQLADGNGDIAENIVSLYNIASALLAADEESGYQVEKLLALVE